MSGFIGEYEVNMDAKGRFLLPSGYRKQLPEGADLQFVMKREETKCLSLYTMPDWEKLRDKLAGLNELNPKVMMLRRLMLNGASIVELDSAGRLLVPKSLQAFAGLSKNLVLFANLNKLEIWDKDTYYTYLQEHSGDLLNLMNDAFGDSYTDPLNK